MPATLKNTFCDSVNLKANRICILDVREQAENVCPLLHPRLLWKEALGWLTPVLEPTDNKAEPKSSC